MRLFIAINFSNLTRSTLLDLRDRLSSRAERGNFTTPENMHITLAFLGECSAKQAAAARTAMSLTRFRPFEILIERAGCFKRGVTSEAQAISAGKDSGKSESLWWAGVRESASLLDLHRDLTYNLTAAGFALDKRRFNPHITLGRRVVTDAEPWLTELFGETIRNIDLMKSERINGRMAYTPIYTETATE